MKFLTTNKFFRIIKRLLLLLPLSFLMVTSLYVIINPNAKDSYYGETINDSELVSLGNNFTDINTTYYLYSSDINADLFTGSDTIYITDFSLTERGIMSEANYNALITNLDRITILQYYLNSPLNFRFYGYDEGTLTLFANIPIAANFVISFHLENQNNVLTSLLKYYVYNQYSYLNNALEFGMYEFNNIGFGKLNLISWFVNIFSNNTNNVYIQFANSYFNYVLFVECVAILPMFIHWIIHLFEDAIDFVKLGNKKRKDND